MTSYLQKPIDLRVLANDVFAALEEELNDIGRQLGELRMTVPMLYIESKRETGAP